MKRVGYLDALRFIATVLVILIHTSSGWFESDLGQGEEQFIYGFYKHLGVIAVPIFVMITGGLILDPKRETPYSIVLAKYVRRIALALLVFGLPMCLAESYLTGGGILKGLYNFFIGQSWDHMWYLYMLIGLYLLSPVFKPFLEYSNKKTIEFALLVLFLVSVLLPSLKNYGIPITSWTILSTPFIFYYVLGYYLRHIEDLHINSMGCGILVILFVLMIMLIETKGFPFSSHLSQYYDLKTFFGATAMFLFFKRMNFKWRIADFMAPHCFAIYIIHLVFINVFYKFLQIGPSHYMPATIGVIVFSILFFMLSFLTSCCMRLIPPLRKYVL